MLVGLIADVHANLPALNAVLRDMPAVDQLVCVGDVVGYNPMPTECVQLIRDRADIVVRGNHDGAIDRPKTMLGNPMARNGLEFAREQVSDDQAGWLQSLPRTATFHNGRYLVVHSHPEHSGEYVFPDEFSRLSEYCDGYRGIVLGHTHIPHVEDAEDCLVINPGSVGQPRDGDSRASYAIFNTDSNKVEIRRVPYNIDEVYHHIVVNDLPTAAGERLFDGE